MIDTEPSAKKPTDEKARPRHWIGVILTYLLMAERGKLGKDQNVKPWDKVLAPLMAVSITFPLLIVAGLDHRCSWSPEFPTWLMILGFVLIIFGYSFATWAIAENRFFSVMMRIQLERGHTVCDSGPYRIVRHPGYANRVRYRLIPGIY